MSNISKRRKEGSRTKIKSMGDHKEFLKRITKTLYYGQLPSLPCLSLPVTEISCELWSVSQRGRSLRRLHADAAAGIARSACVSPCALVLAILYLERLNTCNPEYLTSAAPAELFLVSLMVGNKFLQDDGEDDEVICSEWAASGGIDLKHLKKLEVDFLNAIDWNVYVSEKSFETGLLWLERQVALKQAQLRGFFTYTDLSATCELAAVSELLRAAAACVALSLAYLASLATCLASALVVSRAWLPMLQYLASKNLATSAVNTNIITSHGFQHEILNHVGNSTMDISEVENLIAEEVIAASTLKCCSSWTKYHEKVYIKKNWYDGFVAYDWKSFEPWWSRTSVLNWLYQSSLVNPMQRWLEKMNEYADMLKPKLIDVDLTRQAGRCNRYKLDARQQCLRQWLNFSKLSALVVSVSDR
ncbi:protein CNPPD1 [Galleria mellonella]|uniref:Protein CNPPD1 n=1 Tax=Galleria mellonella TaxID=7137 RepID=A0ABM3MMF6_GALME|nr:protein CNPPD1 [Galleria mellonella]